MDGEFCPRRVIESQRRGAGDPVEHHDLCSAPDCEARRFACPLRQRRQDGACQLIAGPFDRPLPEYSDAEAESVLVRRVILIHVPRMRERPQQPMRRARAQTDSPSYLGERQGCFAGTEAFEHRDCPLDRLRSGSSTGIAGCHTSSLAPGPRSQYMIDSIRIITL